MDQAVTGKEKIMHGSKEIIREANALPVDKKVAVIASLLRTLHTPDASNDASWTRLAKKRLRDLRSGRVHPVSGHEVFSKIHRRLAA
jgi:hypothetical protein